MQCPNDDLQMCQNKIHWRLIHCHHHHSGGGEAVVVRCYVLGRHQYQVVAQSLLVGQHGLRVALTWAVCS